MCFKWLKQKLFGSSTDESDDTDSSNDSPNSIENASRPSVDFRHTYAKFETVGENLIVWKATRQGVARLIIPEGTRIFHGSGGDKKRAERAYVDTVFDYFGTGDMGNFDKRTTHHGIRNSKFVYEEGRIVEPNNGFYEEKRTCAAGIHFFCNKDRAVEWHQRNRF